MSLLFAFCKEASRVVDIIEARQIFFAQPKNGRRRLNFTCADKTCRTVRAPVVTGVNYDKVPGEDHIVRQAHFAARAPHVDDCPWIELEHLQDVTDRDEISPKVSNLKQTEIITHFTPVVEEERDQVGETVDYGRLRVIREISDARERRQALQDYLHTTINTTSRLYSVTRCFEILSENERDNLQLQIDGKRRTYKDYFAKTQWCSPEHYWNRIYHGKAHVKRYPSGYSLRFEQWSRAQGSEPCPVNTFIERRKLGVFRGGGLLKAVFEEAAARGKGTLYCYIYGDVSRKVVNGRQMIEIVPWSLHSLAVELLQPEEHLEEASDIAPASGASSEPFQGEAGSGLETPTSRSVPARDGWVEAAEIPHQTLIPRNDLGQPQRIPLPAAPNARRAPFGQTPQTALPPLVPDAGTASWSPARTDDATTSATKDGAPKASATITPVHMLPNTAVDQSGTRAPDASPSASRRVSVPQGPATIRGNEMVRPRSGPEYASSNAPIRDQWPGAREGDAGANEVSLVPGHASQTSHVTSTEESTWRQGWTNFLHSVRNRLFKPPRRS